VKLVFKTFALDGVCNKSIPTKGNGVRCKLAAAVMCAEQQGQKGWKAHHWVFERQEELHSVNDTKETVQNLSKDLGLSAETLETCMNSDATQDMLESMAQEGVAAKIQGTPTIFVNGKLLPRGQSLPVLEALHQKLKP
jgi:protein-disulfide isomerase